MLSVILKAKKLLEILAKENCKKKKNNKKNKTNQKQFRVEKLIKRKGDKLYLQWKGCDSSFNSWIDKKGIV